MNEEYIEVICGKKFNTVKEAREHECTCKECDKYLRKLREDIKKVHDY